MVECWAKRGGWEVAATASDRAAARILASIHHKDEKARARKYVPAGPFQVDLPARLVDELRKLMHTGLWGTSMNKVCENLIAEAMKQRQRAAEMTNPLPKRG